jgi:hypothetical protein
MNHRVLFALLALGFFACSTTTAPDERGSFLDTGTAFEYYGVAIVTSIEPENGAHTVCPDRLIVRFTFVPNDPSVVSDYFYPWYEDRGQKLVVADGYGPPVRWTIEMGISVMSVHRCTRIETYDWPGCTGECIPFPIQFDFPDMDRTHYYEYCD